MVYVAPVAAGTIAIPFFLQTYVGVVPPFVGVAVNVMLVPAQIVVDGVAMDTVGKTFGVTVTVIAFVLATVHVPDASTLL